jgi:hypothetical protein
MAELSREQALLQLTKLQFESQTRRQESQLTAERARIALDEARAKLVAQAVLDSLALAKADLELDDARTERASLLERRRAGRCRRRCRAGGLPRGGPPGQAYCRASATRRRPSSRSRTCRRCR